MPFDFAFKSRECLRLAISQDRKGFDDSVAQSREKVRVVFAHGFKHVACKFAMMRALLDKDEIVDLAKVLPDFGKLSGQ